MMFASLLMSAVALYVVSDLDGTLVFYNNASHHPQHGSHGSSHDAVTLELPASSTGRIGRISLFSFNLLTEIERLLPSRRLIIASGARASTVLQRARLLPQFTYLICENGGRIFERDKENASVFVEDLDFARRHFKQGCDYESGLAELNQFADMCRARGLEVDGNGYVTMFRIRCRSREEEEYVIASLPSALRHTFNLGFLDIQLNPFSKRASVAWLLRKLEEGSEATEYFFLGDDDNDIECAASSAEMFVANPRSERMGDWLAASTSTATAFTEGTDSSISYTRATRPFCITVPRRSLVDHDGCAANLEALRRRVESFLNL